MQTAKYCDVCRYPKEGAGPCSRCADLAREAKERQRRARENIIRRLGGVRAYEDFRLDRLSPTKYNAPLVDAAKSFNPEKDNLYIFGPAGSGKTHTAAAIMRDCSGLVIKSAAFLRECVEAARSDNETEAEVIEHYARRTLCLDDLGVERITPFGLQCLYEFFDARYMAKGGGLIVTANLSLDDLTRKLGEDRIVSRIAGLCKSFSLKGERDFRL